MDLLRNAIPSVGLVLVLLFSGRGQSHDTAYTLWHGEPEPMVDMMVDYGQAACCDGMVEMGAGCCEPLCLTGPQGVVWARGEFLQWWGKGMDTPPLVTDGNTGALDDPATTVLFGGQSLLEQAHSGFRVRLGTWLDYERRLAVEGEYWRLGEINDRFFAQSDGTGNPALFRPFFNVNPRDARGDLDPPAREDAQWIAFPGSLAGGVEVHATSRFEGAGGWLRYNLSCESSEMLVGDPCRGAPLGFFGSRIDFLVGYRYARLNDQLTIQENLTSLLTDHRGGNFAITDAFGASNDFHGADLGMICQWDRGRWSMEMLGRLALGNVRQQVTIAGETVITGSQNDDGIYQGGLLAQTTNMGTHSRDVFAVLPQLGVNVGYQLTPQLQATFGYSFLYLSRVVRAGEQIDLDVNPDYLHPRDSERFVGPARPGFEFHDTDYWAQGLNFGLEYAW